MRTNFNPAAPSPLRECCFGSSAFSRLAGGLSIAMVALLVTQGNAAPAGAHPVARSAAIAPAPTLHTIVPGDTLSAIALKYKVTVGQVVATNSLKNQHFIVAGKTLVIPGRVSAPAPVAAVAAPKPSAAVSAAPASVLGSQPASPGQAPPASLRARSSYSALNAHFDRAADQYGVSSEVLKSLAWQESGWNNAMVSSTGAVGIGQLMPDTVAFVNEVLIPGKALDPHKPADNIQMSAAFYRYLLRENNGDHTLALASYYQGLAAVRRVGLYAETEQYVRSVMAVRANWF